MKDFTPTDYTILAIGIILVFGLLVFVVTPWLLQVSPR